MKIGIRYDKQMKPEAIRQGGFRQVEIPSDWKESITGLKVAGMHVSLKNLTEEGFREVLQQAQSHSADYILLDTMFVEETDCLMNIVRSCRDLICKSGVKLFLENGCRISENGRYCDSPYTDARKLLGIQAACNEILGQVVVWIAVNIGTGNLTEHNMRAFLEDTKGSVGLVHINDNDGRENQRQIPYTFTQGRGRMVTDWVHIIGQLIQYHYEEYLVFDTQGTFARVPEALQTSFCRLLYEMAEMWQAEFHFTSKLADPKKKIILFGTGNFATLYLERYRNQYPPAFFVDNNPETWGKYKEKYVVKKPEAILEIPEEERLVLICNSYYSEIGQQLSSMGIAYDCFWAEYYE